MTKGVSLYELVADIYYIQGTTKPSKKAANPPQK